MLKQILFFIFPLCILIILGAYLLQRNFIYFPSNEQPDRKVYHAEDMQQIGIITADNLVLNAWYKPAEHNKQTILYLHGNAGHIGHRMYLARQFLAEGFGVLLMDYRGYGGNKGHPTELGLYEDGRAAFNFLLNQNINPKHIVLYGESLGTGVATELARENKVCALVLQSPYTHFTALARFHYPWVLLPLRDKFDSLSRMKQITSPILFLHGEQDVVVPYIQGRTLFEAANEPKQWIGFSDKGHNDLWNEQFTTEVTKFINKNCM